mgnify:FL=1
MAKTILLVEDDEDIATLLRLNLQDEGYQIVHEADGGQALARLETQVWDAVILDLMLPGVDGLEICRRIRQMTRYLPVIIISARTSEMHRVLGLEMGADDYIAKPFSSRVVVARVKAVLRRSGALAGEASGAGAGLTFNGWRLDTTRCELYNPQQQAIPLTQGEYGLLLALAQNARRVLNREQLLALTHNESTEVFDRTIDVLIMRLRRKIELNPHQPTLIKTLRGLGYVFSADVTHSEKAA